MSLVIFWCAVPGLQAAARQDQEQEEGLYLTAQFLKPSGSEIGSPTHAANTNTSEWIRSCYSTDPEQKNKYKKVLPLWALRNLCLTWHQKHAVRFLTWQHQLWSFIEKIYAALKVRIWQLTGSSLSTVLPCLDIVENYVHTTWKIHVSCWWREGAQRCYH